MKTLSGEDSSLGTLAGKTLLVVNVASKCGLTPQYAALEALHARLAGRGFSVVGFPCNQFGGQEPGTNEEIKAFCQTNYYVTFPLFEKTSVIGDDQNALYKWLTSKDLNGWNDQLPTWNFCKYLLDENGELIKYYSNKVKPLDEDVLSQVR